MNNLPTASPAEILAISPENLDVANCYLQNQSIEAASQELDIPTDMVAAILAKREIKAYIDSVFMDMGFNNRFKIRNAMDALIKAKFQELEEAGIGSNKDIADLLALSHKMTMEQLDREIKLEAARNGNKPRSQLNVQVNDLSGAGGGAYSNLIERLLKNPNE